jgi:hypothetical protein
MEPGPPEGAGDKDLTKGLRLMFAQLIQLAVAQTRADEQQNIK